MSPARRGPRGAVSAGTVERAQLPGTAPNIMVYIDRCRDGIPTGEFVNGFVKVPIPFHGFDDLLVKMDGVYDYLDFPQAGRAPRFFAGQKWPRPDFPAPRSKRVYEASPLMMRERKALLTFLVQTRYRQNGTWQGIITWLERGKRQCYISALQCLRLMMEAYQEIYIRGQAVGEAGGGRREKHEPAGCASGK